MQRMHSSVCVLTDPNCSKLRFKMDVRHNHWGGTNQVTQCALLPCLQKWANSG